ncbi:restriction endonuclease [Sphingosinicella soli]|uniref:Restriction endonuclease type IV Mrr domain-containing protein n=1 Tax=Sphingosinicella soli TaxID=333708 RepID=A0A7W7B051_9SPHN|nr:restriction endonuclease [Sphingosinicella soli]MBB4631585.1 hypothetical protein [Sphingosinicella soli]
MSSLKEIDFRTVDDLVDFIRGRGYVLDFSDRTYSQFFAAELDADIDHPMYATHGGSKGKRLRRFLELADDATAARTLRALWELRSDYVGEGKDPVAGAERKYQALLARLGAAGEVPPSEPAGPAFDYEKVAALKAEVLELTAMAPQKRGYAFERFLVRLFDLFGMKPREPFRNRGEQIDGSFLLHGVTYLFEAKWQNEPTDAKDLRDFEGKLNEKAAWARGLFISHSGFSESSLETFGRGKRTICMTGLDLYEMLERSIPLNDVIDRKVRRAAEDGRPHTAVRDLF